mgnify:CR=1 FL=1
MLKNVKCARCVKCGKEYEAVPDLTNCSCGGILDIVYDYDYIKAHFTKETLKTRVNPTMWRYRELLPVEDTTPDTPLRVGWSPLYEEPKLAEMLGLGRLWVKDDGINPTASLKDRASAMAVLQSRLLVLRHEEEAKKKKELAGDIKASWGDQMRSYVLHPYQMVKDLRTGCETSQTQAVFDGDIDAFIEAGIRWRHEQRRQAAEEEE